MQEMTIASYLTCEIETIRLFSDLFESPECPSIRNYFMRPKNINAAKMDDSVKMNHLKTMVTGKGREAVAGLVYTAETYDWPEIF